jgi:ABC-type cobalamin/Fe3+-siderophores transport system ATPase subunit
MLPFCYSPLEERPAVCASLLRPGGKSVMSGVGVSLDNVAFRYKAAPVFDDLSLEARPGEFLAIVGPNGCGKSTALKLIVGLNLVERGVVKVGGDDVRKLSRKALSRRVALLTQANHAPPEMTVQDLIAMGRFVHQGFLSRRSAADDEQVAEAISQMQVGELVGRRVGQLSGGQLQRCRMAMTLAQDSDVLLLDEPTTYLDLRHQYAMLERARAQARAGKTVIAVLHDFTHASLYADRVAVMRRGSLVRIGPPETVLTEELVFNVFGVRTYAFRAHGAVMHIPQDARG